MNNATTRSYEPLLKEQIFSRDNSVLPQPDSLRKDKSGFGSLEAMDSLSALKLRDKARIWEPGADAGQKFAQHVLVRRVGRQGGAQPAIPQQRSSGTRKYRSPCRS